MKRHQVMANTEVMSHLPIMTRSSVREIMLQHERTFKEQVHDLHKLYNVQRLLMEKAKSMGLVVSSTTTAHHYHLPSALSESSSLKRKQGFNVVQEPLRDKGTGALKIGMFGQTMPVIGLHEKSNSAKSSVRKRKIDLEQIPEDDTDDEMENQATLNLLARPELGSTSDAETSKQNQTSNYNTTVQPSVDQMVTQLTSPVYSPYPKPPIPPAYDFIGIEKKHADNRTENKNANATLQNKQDNRISQIHNSEWYFQGAQAANTDMNIASGFMNKIQHKRAPLHPTSSLHFQNNNCDKNVQTAEQLNITSGVVQHEFAKSGLRSTGLLDMSLGPPVDNNSQKWLMADNSHIHGYPISAIAAPGDVKPNSTMASNSSITSIEQNRGIWYSQNPFIEAGSQYQPAKTSPPINQIPWLQSCNGAFYLQQMGYNQQGDSARNWNNIHPVLRQHFSTVVLTPQNPPLKPVVALKNEMELLSNNDTDSQQSKITSSEHISLTLETTQSDSESKILKDNLKSSMKTQDFEPGLQLSRNDETKDPDQERVKPSELSAFSSWSKAKDHRLNISMSLTHSNSDAVTDMKTSKATTTMLTTQKFASMEESPDLKVALSILDHQKERRVDVHSLSKSNSEHMQQASKAAEEPDINVNKKGQIRNF